MFPGDNVRDQDHEGALFSESASPPAAIESARALDAVGCFVAIGQSSPTAHRPTVRVG